MIELFWTANKPSNFPVAALEPLMTEDVTVRVGESTNTLHLSASFRNSALSGIGNFPALRIVPNSVRWIVPGDVSVLINRTWNRFNHTGNSLNDVLTSSLQINNFNPRTDTTFTVRTKHNEIKYSIELVVEKEESNNKNASIEIISGPNTGSWPAESESDKIRATCRARFVSMAASITWTLDGKDFPFEVMQTAFIQTPLSTKTPDSPSETSPTEFNQTPEELTTSSPPDSDMTQTGEAASINSTTTATLTTKPEEQYTLQQEIEILPAIQFNEKSLICHVKKVDGGTAESLPTKIVLNLKTGIPEVDADQIDVLEGQHQISWPLAETNKFTTCIFNGGETASSNTECSWRHDFSSNEEIHLGMKVEHCSTNINSTRDISVNVLKAPVITMMVDSEPVTDGTTKSYEEGAQLELGCKAEGGVPDEIRSYTWKIGETTLNNNSSIINFTANRTHNNMKLRCDVDHRAFDNDIYNNTFVTPTSVRKILIIVLVLT